MASMSILPFSVLVWSCLFLDFCNGQDGSKRFLVSTYHWGQWSGYTQCNNIDCSKGTKSRQRYCYDGNYNHVQGYCSGHALELMPCDCINSDCTDLSSACEVLYCTGSYSDWSKTNCRKTCGICSAASSYAVDGDWSSWSAFTSCSVTCGRGSTSRFRTCSNPLPSNGGKPCLGQSREVYWCIKPDCPTAMPSVDGNWGVWTQYTACSHSCGTGTMTRLRYCNNPPPSGNGYGCSGNDHETSTCNAFACSVDGGWSTWSYWSKCTVSCGLGVISRYRTCSTPAPSGNGAPCSGNGTDAHECSTGPCSEWSHWFEGDCSVLCGNGTMERLRHCSTGRDTDCTGVAYEMVACSNVECIQK